MVISGLTLIHSGHKTYFGIKKKNSKAPSLLNGIYVTLTGVLELAIERGLTPEGRVQERVMPLGIFPYQGPAPELSILATIVMDVSDDPKLGDLYRSSTGRTGLFIPGLG
jgi:hypothetical protein